MTQACPDSDYNCITVPPPSVGGTSLVIQTDREAPLVTDVPDLAMTGANIPEYAMLGGALIVAGAIIRWNARRAARA